MTRRRLLRTAQAASLALLFAVGTSCGNDGESDVADTQTDWGPLAVIDLPGGGGGDEFGGEGRLTITDKCVTVPRASEGQVTLVWSTSNTTWDDQNKQISFTGITGNVDLVLSDGATVSVGGDVTNEEAVRNWLVRPHASCPDTLVFVVSAELLEAATDVDWGPLAVIDSPGGGPEEPGGRGTLSITEKCVTVPGCRRGTHARLARLTDLLGSGRERDNLRRFGCPPRRCLSRRERQQAIPDRAIVGWVVEPDESCPDDVTVITNITVLEAQPTPSP